MNETLTRTLSGVLYIFIIISASLYLNSFLILFGILLLLSVNEFCELLRISKLLPLIIAFIVYFFCSYFFQNAILEIILQIFCLIIAILSLHFLYSHDDIKLNTFSKYCYLIGYIIIPFILIAKLPFVETQFNPKIIISLFILIWANDTMAYVVGKSIGKRKLMERISPKKTIEGFIGGMLFSIIFSICIALYYIHQPISYWILISLIVGIFGTLGDLIESKFKRVAGVKDSGTIMPGHGGILDRLDSIIFAGPFVFLLFQIINYVS